MHLSRLAQKRRLKKLESDPLTRWRVTERDWRHFELYDTFQEVSERALRRTSTAEAPWIQVEAVDSRYQKLMVGKTLLEQIRLRLNRPAPQPEIIQAAAALPDLDGRNILKSLDLSQKLGRPDYERELEKYQGRLNLLTRHKAFWDHNVVMVFEGVDARLCHLTPIAAPSEEERAQPYLWRFWRNLPRRGRLAIFDRSWYGRVLVERVEGFCSEADWMRAYGEINDFEEQIHNSGGIILKFWLSISQEEQLRRFELRRDSAFKRFKITDDDWRNRSKWDSYEAAICAMLERTSTEIAPWTLVESEDKYFGRIKILRTLCEGIEARL
jgi:polyphosphate kinase 2 (PPK2 family)